MLKVDTAGLNWVKVLVDASAVLVGVWTMLLVHSRTHRKPAVKSSTAVKMAALCEYRHSLLWPNDEPAIVLGLDDLLRIYNGS
jgi:hypothetical protein